MTPARPSPYEGKGVAPATYRVLAPASDSYSALHWWQEPVCGRWAAMSTTPEPYKLSPELPTSRSSGPLGTGPAAPAVLSPLPPLKPAGERLAALDVLRGITIAGMILVNNPGSWAHIYSPLRHADWNGLTPTDLVFPFFLFIVGVALPFSFDKRIKAGASRNRMIEHVARRSLIILMLGLIMAGFPSWPRIVNPTLPEGWQTLPLTKLLLPIWPGFEHVLPYLLSWRLIAPFVLVIVGVSILFIDEPPLAWPKRAGGRVRKIIGFVLLAGAIAFFAADWDNFQQSKLRVPGVLQRIALCYFCASLIVMLGGVGWRVLWTVVLLGGYWAIVTFCHAPDGYTMPDAANRPTGLLHDWIDAKLLGDHLYRERPDPEGLLSTIPAIATVLIGVLAGSWLRRKPCDEDAAARYKPAAQATGPGGVPAGTEPGRYNAPTDTGVGRYGPLNKAGWLFVAANVLLLAGLWASLEFPLNKKIWTSSYVLATAGLALHLLAICYWLVDIKGYRCWAKPFLVFGTNAIAVYFASGVAAKLIGSAEITLAGGKTVVLKTFIYNTMVSWFSGAATTATTTAASQVADWQELAFKNASLLFPLAYVAVWCLLFVPLYWRKVFIKI